MPSERRQAGSRVCKQSSPQGPEASQPSQVKLKAARQCSSDHVGSANRSRNLRESSRGPSSGGTGPPMQSAVSRDRELPKCQWQRRADLRLGLKESGGGA